MEHKITESAENAALANIVDTYSPCTKIADADELATTAQLLTRLFLTFGEHCTTYHTVNQFMQAEGFMLTGIDTDTPRWMLTSK